MHELFNSLCVIVVLSMFYLSLMSDLISHIFIVMTNLNSIGVKIFRFDFVSFHFTLNATQRKINKQNKQRNHCDMLHLVTKPFASSP